MSAKAVMTVGLLVFVALSVGYLVYSEVGAAAEPAPETKPMAETGPADRVVAYYFHTAKRCKSCLRIEELAEQALRSEFGEALREGRLEWRAVNMEAAGNEHFVRDYELVTSSLVLVDVEDGEQRAWERMDAVWELMDDELMFHAYVVGQARAFLESGA